MNQSVYMYKDLSNDSNALTDTVGSPVAHSRLAFMPLTESSCSSRLQAKRHKSAMFSVPRRERRRNWSSRCYLGCEIPSFEFDNKRQSLPGARRRAKLNPTRAETKVSITALCPVMRIVFKEKRVKGSLYHPST